MVVNRIVYYIIFLLIRSQFCVTINNLVLDSQYYVVGKCDDDFYRHIQDGNRQNK